MTAATPSPVARPLPADRKHSILVASPEMKRRNAKKGIASIQRNAAGAEVVDTDAVAAAAAKAKAAAAPKPAAKTPAPASAPARGASPCRRHRAPTSSACSS